MAEVIPHTPPGAGIDLFPNSGEIFKAAHAPGTRSAGEWAPARRAPLPWAVSILMLFAWACPAVTIAAGDPPEPVSSPAADQPDSLAATWQEPWNPPHAMARRRAWERVVLLPGRIVSLPLSALGYITDESLQYLEQGGRAPIGPAAPSTRARWPVSPRLAHLGDRTGLGAGVEAQVGLPRPVQSRVGVEYAASNKFYNRTRATWAGKPLSLQYGYEWRPQDRFYGVGTSTSEDSVSDYAMQGEFVRASARWGWGHEPVTARRRMVFNAWAGPRAAVTRSGREHHAQSYEERFPALAALTLDERVEHFVSGASLLVDHRTGAPHWSHGWRLMGSAERFAAPVRALALHSADARGAEFTRFQAEAETGFSFMRDPRTVRLAVHVTDQQVTARGDRFLIADMATLGGHQGLAGYSPGRFHDRDMVSGRLTYVFPLVRRLEMDLHSDWGAVYPDVWKDATLKTLHNSLGFALHSRGDRGPRGALGLDVSRETLRLQYTLGGVE